MSIQQTLTSPALRTLTSFSSTCTGSYAFLAALTPNPVIAGLRQAVSDRGLLSNRQPDSANCAAHQPSAEVKIQAVLDKSNETERYTAATFLSNEGIPTRIDHQYKIMHSKYMIVDGQTLETGSSNFIASAERFNQENVLILSEYPVVAQRYELNFVKLWAESNPYQRID